MSDITEDLRAAIDTVATEPTPAPEAAPPPETEVQAATPSVSEDKATGEGRPRGPDGKFIKTDAEIKAEAKAVEPAPAPTEAKPVEPTPTPEVKVPKAPQSWKAVAREEWAKAPPAIREEVLRREAEIQRVMQESADSRQGYQKVKEAIQPFEQMIRAEGGEPIQAIQGLLQTAYALRTAPPQHKAQMIANMVRSFLPGKEGLELLDAALTPGAHQPQVAHQPIPQQPMLDPRVDQMLAQQRAAAQQRAQAQLAEVQGEEFFEDVREDMADIIEAHRKRGVDIDLRSAYNRAIRVNPDVAKVIEQREAAQRATSNGATQRKAAASSVRSTPAASPVVGGEKDLREIIRAQMEGT